MGGLIQAANFTKLVPYAEMFGQGLIITIMLSLCTVVLGAVLGVVLALMRLSDLRPFRGLGLDKNG
ncbi:MAG: amino acid ABC transporter permease, partial [Ruminococcaceae bacterium]|nr:amino acid ABC transporter permease [Oscillospiraceae bacterium]